MPLHKMINTAVPQGFSWKIISYCVNGLEKNAGILPPFT